MRLVKHRDRAALAQLVEKHAAMVAQVCQQVLGTGQDADDAFQATFLILAQRAHAIRRASSVAAWLHGVAYRTAVRAARRRKRPQPVDLNQQIPDDDCVFKLIQRRETLQILHEELHAMPKKYRAVLVLHYLEGKSRGRVADELECTTATVKGRLSRARKLLRVRLAHRGVGLSVALAAVVATSPAAIADLCEVTVDAALDAAAGETPSAPSSAAQLANQGVRSMLLTNNLKVASVAVVACAVALAGVISPEGSTTSAQESGAVDVGLELAAGVDEASIESAPPTGLPMLAVAANTAAVQTPVSETTDDTSTPAHTQSFDADLALRRIESETMLIEAKYKSRRADALRMKAKAMEVEASAHRQPEPGERESVLAHARLLDAQAEVQLLEAEAWREDELGKVLVQKAETLLASSESDANREPAPDDPRREDSKLRTARIAPNDLIQIQTRGAFQDAPIDGVFQIEPSGNVPLGPLYGRAQIAGLNLEEAQAAIEAHLSTMLQDPVVQITWPTIGRETQQLLRELQTLRDEVNRLQSKLNVY